MERAFSELKTEFLSKREIRALSTRSIIASTAPSEGILPLRSFL